MIRREFVIFGVGEFGTNVEYHNAKTYHKDRQRTANQISIYLAAKHLRIIPPFDNTDYRQYQYGNRRRLDTAGSS